MECGVAVDAAWIGLLAWGLVGPGAVDACNCVSEKLAVEPGGKATFPCGSSPNAQRTLGAGRECDGDEIVGHERDSGFAGARDVYLVVAARGRKSDWSYSNVGVVRRKAAGRPPIL